MDLTILFYLVVFGAGVLFSARQIFKREYPYGMWWLVCVSCFVGWMAAIYLNSLHGG